MRRRRNSEESIAIRLVDEHLRARNPKIDNPNDQPTILDTLTEAVSRVPQNEILVHGKRIESMFSDVASALGHCVAVKEADAGELFSMKTNIAIPDFRVLTLEGKEFFVEVKNCHKVGSKYRYRLTRDYLTKLRNYANLFDCELKIAIYWSQYNLWSLVSADAFEFDGGRYSLSMEQCMKRNDMKIIGDCMVGTHRLFLGSSLIPVSRGKLAQMAEWSSTLET